MECIVSQLLTLCTEALTCFAVWFFVCLQFWIGWRFHRGAWKALRRGVANMDVLVALGTDASYFYSVISILHHRFVQHDAMHYVPTVRLQLHQCMCGCAQGQLAGFRRCGVVVLRL